MHALGINRIEREELIAVLGQIPFFAELLQNDATQFDALIEHSSLILVKPGEPVINQGEFDSWFYFVLKGTLKVFLKDDNGLQTHVGYLQPGEVFGALAMLRDEERNATIRAVNDQRCLLIGVDFAPFGELEDFSIINLKTKLAFYQTIVERTLFRLSLYSKRFPEHEMAGKENQLEIFSGEQTSLEHLHFLSKQATAFAELITAWNLSIKQLDDVVASHEMDAIAPNLVNNIDKLLWGLE